MKIRFAVFVSALLAVGIARAQDTSKIVALADVPPPVQNSIQAELNGATVGEIDCVEERGVASYDVAMTTKDGQQRSFTLNADGKMQSLEISLADAPAEVQKSIKTQLGADTLVSIDKTLTEEGLSYDVMATTENGQDRDFSIDPDGRLASAEVLLAETPAAVQATIKAQQRQAKIDSIEASYDDDGTSYAVQLTAKNGAERHFIVAANGKLESQEMTLTQTPALVQNAIKTEVGDGTVDNIEKNFGDSGITFEVDMTTKDGQSRDFSVNNPGKLVTLQILPPEAPPAVKATVRALIGQNKLTRIEEDFADEGDTYDVELTARDGTSRDLTLSADGKLESQMVALTDVSMSAESTITNQLGQNKLTRLEKEFADDGISYEVEMKTKDGDRTFTVTETGNLESIDVSLAETPVEVQTTINSHLGQGNLSGIEKTFDEDGVQYDVSVSTAAGKVRTFTVNSDGTLDN